jgi:hypothetical protein
MFRLIRNESKNTLTRAGIALLWMILLCSGCGNSNPGGGDDAGLQPDSSSGDSTAVVQDGTVTTSDGSVSKKCGNAAVDTGEDCDGTNLNKATCQSIGFTGGTLKCKADCMFDTSSCQGTQQKQYGMPCGGTLGKCAANLVCITANNKGNNEGYCTVECSDSKPCPTTPPGGDCVFSDSSTGKNYCGFLCEASTPNCPTGLACTYNAKYQLYECTTDAPAQCGNNKRELAEECDGTDMNNMTCQGFGYQSGTLKCTSCTFDKSSCTGATSCTNLPPKDCTSGNAACSKIVEFLPRIDPGAAWDVVHPSYMSWLRQDSIMLVKYAAASVKCLMPGSYPEGTGDMSMKNGGTPREPPLDANGVGTGSLRHPTGTHENGVDIDVAYYQKNPTTGNPGNPDNHLREVCEHTINGVDQYHCTAAPTSLDVTRHTLFLAKIMESSRVRVIGVDGKVGPLLQAEAKVQYQAGKISATSYNAFSSKLAFEVTNQGYGWFQFHHHHSHLSTNATTYPTATPPQPPPIEVDSPSAGGLDVAMPSIVPSLTTRVDAIQSRPLDLRALDSASRWPARRTVTIVK